MKIALDIDGVLLDFDGHWAEFGSRALGRQITRANREYHMPTRYMLTQHEAKHIFNELHSQKAWSQIPPLPGAPEAVKQLIAAGHEIVMITASHPTVEDQRRKSLEPFGLENHTMHLTGSPLDGMTKEGALRQEAPDIFVDDQLVNLLHAKECGVPYLAWIDLGDTQPQNGRDNHFAMDAWQFITNCRADSLAHAIELIAEAYPIITPDNKSLSFG